MSWEIPFAVLYLALAALIWFRIIRDQHERALKRYNKQRKRAQKNAPWRNKP